MKHTLYFAILTAMFFLTACEKDPNKVDVTFDHLGDVRVNFISGFAFNGDPLCYTSAGPSIR